MQDTAPNSSVPATETLDGFHFAEWIIHVHQKNGDPVGELLRVAKGHETDWLELKAAVYPSAEHDPAYRTLLEKLKAAKEPKIAKELENAKELYPNVIFKEIAAAVVALHNSRGGVVLIGVDNGGRPVPLLKNNDEKVASPSGDELEDFFRRTVQGKILGVPGTDREKTGGKKTFSYMKAKGKGKGKEKETWTENQTETWTIPVGAVAVKWEQLQFRGAPVLALLVPSLDPAKPPLVAEESFPTEDSKNGKKTTVKRKVLLMRTPGDVGQTQKRTIEKAWNEDGTDWSDFIRERKTNYLDSGDLARLRRDLSRVIPFAFDRTPTAHFVGRDMELEKLHNLLSDEKIPVVTGPGGTGKSELVLQYAVRHKDDYPGGLFQINMETAKDWDVAFQKLLGITSEDMHRLLGFSDNNDKKKQEEPLKRLSAKEIAGALARRAEREGPILLVLDNVESTETFFGESIFEREAALPPDVRIVATARKSDVEFGNAGRCIEFMLEDLSLEAARELLLRNHPAETDAERETAAKVAELLGRRPLYLCRVLALLIGKPVPFARSYSDLESKLRESRLRLETVGTAMKKTRDDRTPEALWGLTRYALSSNPAWITLAHVASFFSPDGFKKHVLRRLWGALAAPDADTDEAFEEALSVLRWHWLVSGDGENLRMHRLDIDALRQSARKDDPEIEKKIGKTLSRFDEVSARDWFSLAENTDVLLNMPRPYLFGNKRSFEERSFQLALLERNSELGAICEWKLLRGEEWSRLLAEQPQFFDRCDRKKLDGWDWSRLLAERPQFFDWCDRKKLDGWDWSYLLAEQPRFFDRCDRAKMDGRNWVYLLAKQPQLFDKHDRNKLDGDSWSRLLAARPEFADDCPWTILGGKDWARLLAERPEFAERYEDWKDKLEGEDWVHLLTDRPEFAERYENWKDKLGWRLASGYWKALLIRQPQFGHLCSFSRFTKNDWLDLLVEQPRFADHCDWNEPSTKARMEWIDNAEYDQFDERIVGERMIVRLSFDGNDWVRLLSKQPGFSDKCDWITLRSKDWVNLLVARPDFSARCEWEELNGAEWALLLAKQPQFSEKCKWDKLDGENWSRLLQDQPRFADRCPWKTLDGSNWADLIAKRPNFSNWCEWEKLDGSNWSRLINEEPRFASKCDWKKLKAQDWFALIAEQPQFAARCPWDKLVRKTPDPRFPFLDSSSLLELARSDFSEFVPWRTIEFSGTDISNILANEPRFATVLPLDRLSGDNWAFILSCKPELHAFCRWWNKLDGEDWARLLSERPEFFDRCDRTKLDGRDWMSMVSAQPKFASECPLEKLDSKDLVWFLSKHPKFANRSSLEKLDGRNWAMLLGKQPSLFEFCPFDKLDGGGWMELLDAQPLFADLCPWDKLNGRQKDEFRKQFLKSAKHEISFCWGDSGEVELAMGMLSSFAKAKEAGCCFYRGLSREEDDDETSKEDAAQFYRRSADLGNKSAQYRLGLMFMEGCGVPQSDEKAVSFFRKAAEQGLSAAQCNIGFMFAYGRGVVQSHKEAVKWFRKAAQQGDAQAQFNLGWAYGNGLGVEKSREKALAWWRKAAARGHVEAHFKLGVAYANGLGVEQSDEEALKWFRKSAEWGHSEGQILWGRALLFGKNVTRNEKEALNWFWRAKEQDNENALAWIGYCFATGAGRPKDDEAAESFFSKLRSPADGFNEIAWGLFEAGRASEALPFAEKAVAAFRVNEDFPTDGKINILDTLAAVLDALERAEGTKKVCSEILSLMQDGDDSKNREVALVRLGQACHRLGDKAGATDAWSKALVLVEKHGGKHAKYGESADELRRLIRESGAADA